MACSILGLKFTLRSSTTLRPIHIDILLQGRPWFQRLHNLLKAENQLETTMLWITLCITSPTLAHGFCLTLGEGFITGWDDFQWCLIYFSWWLKVATKFWMLVFHHLKLSFWFFAYLSLNFLVFCLLRFLCQLLEV